MTNKQSYLSEAIQGFGKFTVFSVREILSGSRVFWSLVIGLSICIGLGLVAYMKQFDDGLITTALRDQMSWGFYIGNFTFLVGVAAAAVLLVIPAYVYNWKPIKEVVILGEILAISAIIMSMLFVLVDVGRPDRVWHLIPGIGRLNVPSSMLGWDVLVLNGYLLSNLAIVTSLLVNLFLGKEPNKKIFYPLVLLSIPAAIGIHTVTAFLYNGFPARPFWNAAILAPRFLASAFCSGPALLLMLMQLLRRFTDFEIKDSAIWKVAELMAYAMFLNLFLLGAEVFKEYYSATEHLIHMKYMFQGIDGHRAIAPWMWLSVVSSTIAFLLFLIPRTRTHPVTLNIGCILIFIGVYLEKGMGLVISGMTPDTLGEIYEYLPTWNELFVAQGIFAIGSLVFIFLVKVATPIMLEYNSRESAD